MKDLIAITIITSYSNTQAKSLDGSSLNLTSLKNAFPYETLNPYKKTIVFDNVVMNPLAVTNEILHDREVLAKMRMILKALVVLIWHFLVRVVGTTNTNLKLSEDAKLIW